MSILAVAVGPGSFTSAIMMGMIQGLSYAQLFQSLKLAPTRMAQECFDKDKADSVVSLIDARMSEVYFGLTRPMPKGVMQLQKRGRIWLSRQTL